MTLVPGSMCLEPVDHMDTQGRGEIAFGFPGVVNLRDQGGDGYIPAIRYCFQFAPENVFKRQAGAVAVKGNGVLADHDGKLFP